MLSQGRGDSGGWGIRMRYVIIHNSLLDTLESQCTSIEAMLHSRRRAWNKLMYLVSWMNEQANQHQHAYIP